MPHKPVRRSFNKLQLLRDHPIFGALLADGLGKLSTYAVRQTVKRGKTIFSKGDTTANLFGVLSGTIKITSRSTDGREGLFNLISDGSVFGEIALLDGGPRTADATAVTNCELIVIERRDFEVLLRERPEIAVRMMEVLCRRIRQTTAQLEDLMFLDMQARLAKALLQLSEKSKSSHAGRTIELTQRDLSEIIGISRETANKQLRLWEKRKWLILHHRHIEVLAPEALEAIATADASEESSAGCARSRLEANPEAP